MRHIAAAVLVWFALAVAAFTAQAAEPELKTYRQKVSYAFGLDLGQSLKNLEYDFDVDAVTRQHRVERLGAAADTEHAHVRVAFEAVPEQLTDEAMVVENEDVVGRR